MRLRRYREPRYVPLEELPPGTYSVWHLPVAKVANRAPRQRWYSRFLARWGLD